MAPRLVRWGAAALLASIASLAAAQAPKLKAPNVVEIHSRLITSGQPPADTLANLAAQGFEAVIYLAPPTVGDAVRDEALIVARQGITFVNIPIKFDAPTERDYAAFAGVLAALSDRKVLVHCQVNLRASTMVFLYRVIAAKEDPMKAYEAVAAVWTPHGAWKPLVSGLLRKHDVKFEPY